MSTPEVIVRRWFREVWDEGREEAIDRLMVPDAKVHGLAGETIVGPEQFKPYFHTMHAALGDLEITVARTIVQGDMVAAHCRVVARHVGDALGGAPSGKVVDFWGVTIARVVGDQLVEGWNCFDFLTMYQQMGWVANPVVPLG